MDVQSMRRVDKKAAKPEDVSFRKEMTSLRQEDVYEKIKFKF